MGLQEILAEKKEWRKHMARVNALPQDYKVVYKEIQKYLFKVGPLELIDGIKPLADVLELFEEGAARGDAVLDVTGKDVAAFCDRLIQDSKTQSDEYEEQVNQEVKKALKKEMNRKKK
ncbi:DUF1048 domain-containing protein [Listeria kieliensis]